MITLLCGLPVAHAETFEGRAAVVLDTLRAEDMLSPGGSGKLPYGHAVARLAEDPTHVEAINYIAESGTGGEPPFNCLYMMRGYLTAPESFSGEQKANIRAFGESVDEWNMDYTENHKVLLWSTAYLLAQSFPDGTWQWDGQAVDSLALMNFVRTTIAEYGQNVFNRGYSDLLSPVYELYKAAAWMNLYDFAEDESVKSMADAMLTYHLTLLALGSFEEVILPPYSRGSGAVFNNQLSEESQWLLWLFWGHGGANAAEVVSASNPEWIVALSDWRPPETVNRIARGEVETPYTFKTQQPFFFAADPLHMMRTSYLTDSYYISSGVYRMDLDGLDVHGARQVVHDDLFGIAWESDAQLKYLSVMHPYWNGAAGENNWSSRGSPFMQVVQSRNTAIVAFDIPTEDPWTDVEPWAGERAETPLPIAEIRYPILGTDFSNEWGDDWFSLDTGSTYIAVKVFQSGWRRDRRILQASGWHVVKSKGNDGEPWKTGFLFEVARAEDYASIGAFMADVMDNPLSIDLETLAVAYTSTLGDVLEMDYTVSLEVPEFSVPGFTLNGDPVSFDEWPHMASPLTHLEGNVLTLATDDPGLVHVADWSGTFPVIETRETGGDPTWVGWPIVDGWVNTESFMGWLYVEEGDWDWVRSLSLDKYIFLPEASVGDRGAWIFVPSEPGPSFANMAADWN